MTTYANLTPSAIRAAVAECGAGTLEVSPSLVLALLSAIDARDQVIAGLSADVARLVAEYNELSAANVRIRPYIDVRT